jgi:hypothetical protein
MHDPRGKKLWVCKPNTRRGHEHRVKKLQGGKLDRGWLARDPRRKWWVHRKEKNKLRVREPKRNNGCMNLSRTKGA